MGLQLGIRGLKGHQVGAAAFFGGGLGSQPGVEIDLRGGDGLPTLHSLPGQLGEPGQRISRRVSPDLAHNRHR
ncbi:MAG: hypothetical protein ACPHCN_18870 [Mycobacterium sp.]